MKTLQDFIADYNHSRTMQKVKLKNDIIIAFGQHLEQLVKSASYVDVPTQTWNVFVPDACFTSTQERLNWVSEIQNYFSQFGFNNVVLKYNEETCQYKLTITFNLQ